MPVNFLNLPGLRVLDFKETDTECHVRAEPAAISRLCPHCGRSNDTIKHAPKTLFVRDMGSQGKQVIIHLDAPRLLCKPCKKTFTAAVPEVDTARQMTERLVKWIGRNSLEYTYAEIAKQVGVDEKTVRNIFDEYVLTLGKELKRETPVWLGIDEIKLGRFRAVFTNLKEHALIDMLEDRYGTSIIKFLSALENKEQISHCGIDMWRPYRIAVQKVLPGTKIVVDKFHVVSKANAAFDAVRRGLNQGETKKLTAGLKKAHKLFAKRAADLNDEQFLTVSGWLNSVPILAEAYDLKERLYAVYEVETKEEAWAEYLNWEASIPEHLAKPFRAVKTAFRNWKPFILNYFDDARVTNAFTESFNAKIRAVYRNGRGYTFERLRAKVLYTDMFQKRIKIQEKTRVKKRQRFNEVADMMMMVGDFDSFSGYETRITERTGIAGASLPTLLYQISKGHF